MESKYTEGQVVQDLRKKHDLDVDPNRKIIRELKRNSAGKESIPAKGDVGIRSKGKIDYLTRYMGWTHYFVNSFK